MSKFEIKINTKKIEKELNKKVNEIVQNKQKEMIVKRNRENGTMSVLSQNAETMLEVFLDKYNKDKDYSIQGNISEFPDYMRFSIKDNMENLKLYGYISNYNVFIDGGWFVILAPEALQYFEKKGSREELFEELADSEKKLLKEIIEVENNNEDISEYLKEKLNGYDGNIYTIDARKVSEETLGRYFPNTPMLAAIVKVTGIMSDEAFLEDMKGSFKHKFAKKPEVIEGNMKALKLALEMVTQI